MDAGMRLPRLAGIVLAVGARVCGLAGCRQLGACGGTCADGHSTPTRAASPVTAGATAPGGVPPSFGGQTTCPVTGAALATAKGPVAVTVGGETIFVCCAGCAAKVRRDPEPYLAKVRAERAGRTPAAPALLPVATAQPLGGQKTCPVTGEPLDPTSAVAVDAGGRTIYVCCAGCAAKVRKDPGPYLARVLAERGR